MSSKIEDNKKISNDIEMSFSEHVEEFRQRLFFSLIIFSTITVGCFYFLDSIVEIVKSPAVGIKFFQFAPGEYFFTSIKLVIYSGLVLSSPIFIYQILLFLLPGMTYQEQKIIVPLLVNSYLLFIIGILFSYKILIPSALSFFLQYGANVVDPLWSFEQYFEFFSFLSFTCGLGFQIPIVQLVLCITKVVKPEGLIKAWRYVILASTILAAVLTPTVDPLTQLFLSTAFLLLYFAGYFLTKSILGKEN
jgi:sec-independent protein translocase protein TatC